MINPFTSPNLELEIRSTGQDKGEIAVQDWPKFYAEEGEKSVLNYERTPHGLLKQYISKAGLNLQGDIVTDYNLTKATVTKRDGLPITSKTSIIMSSYGHAKECEEAIDSITSNTSIPFELIVSDNPHPDGSYKVREMLKTKDIGLILNETNLGDMGALNAGIKLATGDQICVVNNDIIATPGWLYSLLQVAVQEPDAGIVSGRTNNITGDQIVNGAPSNGYVSSNHKLLDLFHEYWAEQHELGWWKTLRVRSFVCLLTKRFLDAGGHISEIYGKGNYDDDDLCMQALTKDLSVYIADQCYVHHLGSLSFQENMNDFLLSLSVNKQKFIEEWADYPGLSEKIIAKDNIVPTTRQDSISWRLL